MNHWKDELDGIAGDFSGEQERLSSGFNRRLSKKSSRKPLYIAAITSLIVSIIGIAIFAWSTGLTDDQYSSDRPVYFNENVYKLYQAIFIDSEETERNKQAFTGMISMLAIEHHAHEKGFVLNEEEYKKAYNEAISRYTDFEDSNEYEMFLKAAEFFNMSEKRFVETILAPTEAKITIYNKMLDQDEWQYYSLMLSKYESMYEKEIKELANKLGVEYEKIINYGIYEGVIVAIEPNKLLVVEGATSEDIASLEPLQIVEKYNTGVWFDYEHLEQSFLIGDRVLVSFDDMDLSVPAQTRANYIELMERPKNSVIFYDENLFHYFALHFLHLEDEQLQKELAFELYIEWLNLMEDAYLFGYAYEDTEYVHVKAGVLQEFETTIGAPPIKREAIEAYASKLNIPVDQFIQDMAEVETHQRLVHEWKDGNAISMYGQAMLEIFKIDHEIALNELAQRFGLNFSLDNLSSNIPFYIGKVVENKDGNIKIITGKTVEETVLMSQEEIAQRNDSGLWFNTKLTPRISVGDVVKIHYDSFGLARAVTEPVVPIKISIIKDVE